MSIPFMNDIHMNFIGNDVHIDVVCKGESFFLVHPFVHTRPVGL